MSTPAGGRPRPSNSSRDLPIHQQSRWKPGDLSNHVNWVAMSSTAQHSSARLVDRHPATSGAELVATLVPPPQFNGASFDSYRPDEAYPSQAEARDLLRAFSEPETPMA